MYRKNVRSLIEVIDAARPRSGEGMVWWLGQQSFVVKLGRLVVYLDPYLSPSKSRRKAPFLAPEAVTNATLIFGTHDHGDHIDRPVWPALAAASPGAKFVVPDRLLDRLPAELGLPRNRFIGLNDGQSIESDGIRVTGIAAAHELLDQDPRTGLHSFLGYVVEGNGVTLYHAGDTCVYEGLLTKLKRWQFDVVMLPINGRDAERLRRNCIGNMTYQEAADLAGVLRPGLTIPAHYDMFEGNRENPHKFVDYMHVKYPDLPVKVCEYCRAVSVGAGS